MWNLRPRWATNIVRTLRRKSVPIWRVFLLLISVREISLEKSTFPTKRSGDENDACSAPRNPKKKRAPVHSDVEDQLYAWFLSEREKGLAVTRAELQDKAIEIAADLQITVFKASAGWLTKFIKRKLLSFRTPTHHARKAVFTEKDLEEELEFLLRLYDVTALGSTPKDHVFNFDQTMIRLVSPKTKTYSPKGAKEVIVKQPPGEKEEITVALTIRADGGKYPATIVFKGGVSGELSDNIMAGLKVPANVIVRSSASTWWSEKLDHEWIKSTFFPSGQPDILVRDQAPVHKLVSSEMVLRERNVVQIFIPGGRTGEYQPLDVSVNKAVKAYFRTEYQLWRKTHNDVTKAGNLKKPGRQDFINMVSAAWEKVSNDLVRKSFYAAQVLVAEDWMGEKENISDEIIAEDNDELEISLFSDSVLQCDDCDGSELSNGLPE